MRFLPTTLAVVIAASVYTVPAPVQANDQLVANICNYVQADDKNRLRKKLKEARVKLRNVYEGVACEGDSLLRFAMKSGANDVGEFMAKRLSTEDLSVKEADGMTVVEWAEGNGHGGSPITAAIKERLAGN
ncbi:MULTISPECIES: DUF3718 domain-containing protein [Shewanella]|uniref:DUF3718 domain-containing protein n=1 Tax=Shewanella marisflavi TaxID=260364 RepID=A0AAC9U1A1_9GAMM|nr:MULTISPECIES: DUF3718 domain-containing protein [Shewanella]ASJ97811.1 hypothetical protein CFF01_15130 [Shewanella marisflavi]QDF76376.1 DUF3718 domain-containing protein [Shewanella marisflavi]